MGKSGHIGRKWQRHLLRQARRLSLCILAAGHGDLGMLFVVMYLLQFPTRKSDEIMMLMPPLSILCTSYYD